ncbi:hypothetical protein KAT08_00200 [Candidatus Babeliales bacterium]|nr:hypothetical protein [Candidatus Babeliales bacterium]
MESAKNNFTFLKILLITVILFSAILFLGCSKKESTVGGVLVGGGLGAGVGAAAGGTEGAVAGGLIGAVTGGLVGHSIGKDKHKRKRK